MHTTQPLVGVIMGSQSDWRVMKAATEMLAKLNVPYEARIISAHRTPARLFEYASSARARGIKVIIAGAGGSAHLPGMAAALSRCVPVLGVPVNDKNGNVVKDLAARGSMDEMPPGVPLASFSLGTAGATNAALQAAMILATFDEALYQRLVEFSDAQRDAVPLEPKDE